MRTDGVKHLEDLRQRCTIEPDTGCWVWKGSMNASGVPSVNVSPGVVGPVRAVVSARRAAWLLSGRRAGARQAVYRAECCSEPRCINPLHAGVGMLGAQTRISARRDPDLVRHPDKIAGLMRYRIAQALAPERVAEIQAALDDGRTLQEVAQSFGVHVQTARAIGRRQHVHQRNGLRREASVFAWAATS